MKRKIVVASSVVSTLVILIVYVFISLHFSPESLTRVEVHLNFFDYITKNPIEGLEISFCMRISEQEFYTLSGISDEDGKVSSLVPLKTYDVKLSAANVSISGVWALLQTIGDEEFFVNRDKWVIKDFRPFLLNRTEYSFNDVNLRRERVESTLVFRLDFYLTQATIVEVRDPVLEASGLDPHLKIDVLKRNFTRYLWGNRVFIVSPSLIQIDLDVKYVIYNVQPLAFRVSISVDTENRTFIDLTPYYVEAFSRSQIGQLDNMFDYLVSYGFDVVDFRNKLGRIERLFELAMEGLESNDVDAFQRYIQLAMNSYRDLYMETVRIYTSGLVWVPSLLIVFLFFALSLSKLIAENSLILFLVFLVAILCLFILTNPYVRLFVFNPSAFVQSFTQSIIFQFFFQLLPIMLLIVVCCLGQIRTFVWEIFEVSIRNLKRRKLKTALALTTIVIVSTSAMCLLTITVRKQMFMVVNQNTTPIVDSGFVIYKVGYQRPFFSEEKPVKYYMPIQWYEVKWLSEHESVESMSVYGIKQVSFARADGLTIDRFNQFNLIVVNTSFLGYYQNISKVLSTEWFSQADRNMVIIGSIIANKYSLQAGSEVLIDGRTFLVKSFVDEEAAARNLQDIDGSPFLFDVYDLETGKIDEDSFIIGDIKDFDYNFISILKVSIVLRDQHTQDLNQIIEEVQSFGLDFGETDEYSYIKTFSMQVITQQTVYSVESTTPSTFVFGETPIIPIVIAVLMLFVNIMGTVFERKSEIRTIHVIGASPLRIGLIFITEGLIFGVIGGVFSYVFGFLAVQTTNMALPDLVSKNIIGGAPFAVTFSTAVLTSLLGCLYPAIQSMKVVVPSGRMRHQLKDIIELHDQTACLKVPIRIEESEIRKFERYLENLSTEVKMLYKFMSISSPCIKEINGRPAFSIIVDMSVKGYETASFLVEIIVAAENNLSVTIQPLDAKRVKTERWSRIHKDNINELSQFLREKILEFKICEKIEILPSNKEPKNQDYGF
ncbi:ABC transporter permease [Candidatus Bathyarchaeota archaeon]|nr:ABC transporter permease [Candidatus Bathyarchaeota archaeon]